MPAISKKRLAQMEAHNQFMRRLAQYGPGQVPCRGPHSGAWQSRNSTLAEYAARACWQCPVVAQCREYALAHEPHRSDIWGGMRPRQAQQQAEFDLGDVA